ncbi:RING-H2 finger protein ATL22-like [Vitis riparia]|uniref:RING-H2 finger protein ATL22-like n=1 Tax=Vitis riparia TaxID=96939 RepID=UPI00155AA8FD|nr:RING-H2 finger protein ATL22-like [Vitis riparia]
MSWSRVGYRICKIFPGDNEEVVRWNVIPVHVWGMETSRHMDRAQDNDGELTASIINKEQYLLGKHTVIVRHQELILDDPRYSIIYQMFRLQRIPHAYSQLLICKVASLARSMIMPNVRPIFIVIMNVTTYVSRPLMELIIEDIDNERLATVVTTSMQDEAMKIVPATKSSIDKLEKVKMKLDDRCSICLEEFTSEMEEVVRMPCSHVYHTPCIVKWLEYNHLCPLCRFEMPKSVA